MATLYDLALQAIRKHWAENDNAYPQKLLLTPAQYDELMRARRNGRVAINMGDEGMDKERFMGVPLTQSDTTPGVLVAADGQEWPLAGG
ncbi:hypothetical protein [Pseudacidovorax sp. RU35E]|uniref:hypothetical protein n=1 Tax=Pseudacidovorax sp. RU35E TaxID=1907403 RepID=UPI000953C898|nr:hypothetical protein [Pseudacidovorax sp. RU35E]SIR67585.1 hypothetical protein SAMN05880557_11648 [Pseudacidovorax sp. RU35E]